MYESYQKCTESALDFTDFYKIDFQTCSFADLYHDKEPT